MRLYDPPRVGVIVSNSILEFLNSIESIPDVVPAFMENDDFTKREIRSNLKEYKMSCRIPRQKKEYKPKEKKRWITQKSH